MGRSSIDRSTGKDLTCHVYRCPDCGRYGVMISSKYCSECGTVNRWHGEEKQLVAEDIMKALERIEEKIDHLKRQAHESQND